MLSKPMVVLGDGQSNAVEPAGGGGCIAAHHTVRVQDGGSRPLSALVPGDVVLTSEGYKPYLGSMHDLGVSPTLVLSIAHGRSVELTHDHLVKTAAGFVTASAVAVGTLVATVTEDGTEELQPVVGVAASRSEVAAPLTRSGTIIVHGVVLSCYGGIRSHAAANVLSMPARLGVVKDRHAYLRALVWLYHRLPGVVRAHITPDGGLWL